MWQDNNNAYAGSSGGQHFYGQQPSGVPLQFYAPSPVGSSFYGSSRTSLDGNVGAQGSIVSGAPPAYGGNIQSGGWWTAFGTGGLEGEPPLLEGMFHYVVYARTECRIYLSLRARNKLSSYKSQIFDRPQSAAKSRRPYHGRCQLGGSTALHHMFWYFLTLCKFPQHIIE